MDLMAMIENAMTSPVIYLAILALATLDAFLPFLPSESVVIAAAVFAVSGIPSLPLIIVLAALGAFVGDHIGYLIGRLLRERRPGGRLIRAADRIAPHLHRRGGALIVAGRFVPGGRTAIVTASGATGYPLTRFTFFTAIAAVTWAGYSGLIGYLGGVAFESNSTLGLAVGLGLALSITALGELVRHVSRRRRAAGSWSPSALSAPRRPTRRCGALSGRAGPRSEGRPGAARHRVRSGRRWPGRRGR
ncbi:DedA family protein [Verrucosispora sp. WMMA2121]|uniref:DedA family protein n=1 Tax=Verrucosispora sp. WMMA2121 TaxID=3015164 RepID=UPI0022B5F073|nr:DedA family protein [Verrucosispora sp. WMMA2121]MCZ7421967.1 DedA family protein [Verrucosispora sp. WMMA2121]